MNLADTSSLVQTIRSYSHFDTSELEQVADFCLGVQHRQTFNLRTQNGLSTLVDFKADVSTLIAFLLCRLPVDQRKDLGLVNEDVDLLLEGLDVLQQVTDLHSVQDIHNIESARKMLLAMASDFRVILILLAWRRADLFEISRYNRVLRRQIARQTLEIFVPIAGRLGIYTLKRRLEDRCFAFLSESSFSSLKHAFEQRQELHPSSLESLIKTLQRFLREQGVSARVTGRVKGLYSTYSKLKKKGGGTLDDIYDLLALRVVVEHEDDCYTALSLVNNQWTAVEGRFKDYISMPKVNGYRSLHTAVLGMIPGSSRPVEIQIRTEDMHQEAEYGIAAHWWYESENLRSVKTYQDFKSLPDHQEKLQWMQNLAQVQFHLQGDNAPDSFQFFSDRLFLLSEDNEVIELPEFSTPLDFAYALSSDLGNHCGRVTVNDKVVSLDYVLQSGDRVVITPSPQVAPNLYWLSLVRTDKAKRAIRRWIYGQGEEAVLQQGMAMINRRLKNAELSELDDQLSLLRSFPRKTSSLRDRQSLLIDVGRGVLGVDEVVDHIIPREQEKHRHRVSFPAAVKKNSSDLSRRIFVAGEAGLQTKIATCCLPTRHDSVIGYVTRGGFVSLHQKTCKVLSSLDSARLVEAHWEHEQSFPKSIRFKVYVTSINMLAQLSAVLKKEQASLTSFSHVQKHAGYELFLQVLLPSQAALDAVVSAWRQIPRVSSVQLVEITEELVLSA